MTTKTLDALAVSKATGCSIVRAQQWLPHLLAAMARFEINTPLRQAAFLAQIGHESGGLLLMSENLNYSADGLQKVFGKYFPTRQMAEMYARQPQKIANIVYANRMGNGDTASGDGWNYRGRGPIALTGRNGYIAAGKGIGLDLVNDPNSVCDPRVGSLVAGWFWSANNINKFADAQDFDGVSDVVNIGRKTKTQGDSIGYAHRLSLYKAALEALT